MEWYLTLKRIMLVPFYLVIQEMLMKAILLRQLDELLRFQLVTH